MPDKFDYYLEKAVRAALPPDACTAENSDQFRSHIRKHVLLLVLHRLGRVIDRIVP